MIKPVALSLFFSIGVLVLALVTVVARSRRHQDDLQQPQLVHVSTPNTLADKPAPPPVQRPVIPAVANGSAGPSNSAASASPRLIVAAPSQNKLFESLRAPGDMRLEIPADTAHWEDLIPPSHVDLTKLARNAAIIRNPDGGKAIKIDGSNSPDFSLAFPDQPVGVVDYLLSFHHTGSAERSVLFFGLPLKDRQVFLTVDPAAGAGLGPIANIPFDRNGTAQPAARIPPDKSTNLYFRIDSTVGGGKQVAVTVGLDGHLLLHWTGNASDLALTYSNPTLILGGVDTAILLTQCKRHVVPTAP